MFNEYYRFFEFSISKIRISKKIINSKAPRISIKLLFTCLILLCLLQSFAKAQEISAPSQIKINKQIGIELEFSNWLLVSGVAVVPALTALGFVGFASDPHLSQSFWPALGLLTYATGYVAMAKKIIRKQVINPTHPTYGAYLMAKLEKSYRRLCQAYSCDVLNDVTKAFGKNGFPCIVVKFQDFQIIIAQDPNVFELKVLFDNIYTVEQNRGLIDRFVYQQMSDHNLRPFKDSILTGAHYNYGLIDYFLLDGPTVNSGNENPKKSDQYVFDILLFRNFIADFYNNIELAAGVLGSDPINANINIRNSLKLNNLRDIFLAIDTSELTNDFYSINAIARVLQEYVHHYYFSSALSVHSIIESTIPLIQKRLELRFLRAPKNSEEVYLLAKLFHARIEHLRNIREAIPFRSSEVSFDPAIQLAIFRKYVEEPGLNFDDYKRFVPKSMKIYLENHSTFNFDSCRSLLFSY